jgi:hypothetical protein
MSKTFTFNLAEIDLSESETIDEKGKKTQWVNFNLAPIVAPIVVELAKINGFHVSEKGLRWSCQKKRGGLLSAGFVKETPAREAPAPASKGADQSALEAKLATLEKALALLLTQTSQAQAPAPAQKAKRTGTKG